MKPNVRCAGDGDMAVIRVSGTKIHRTLHGEPCGWKGTRVNGLPAAFLSEPQYHQAATTKACPRCGGRVQLIPTT